MYSTSKSNQTIFFQPDVHCTLVALVRIWCISNLRVFGPISLGSPLKFRLFCAHHENAIGGFCQVPTWVLEYLLPQIALHLALGFVESKKCYAALII